MGFSRIVISSGHSIKCPGASAILDEVTEATKVADRLAQELDIRGVETEVFHDTTSTTVDQNLNKIVDFHNARNRDLDISVHFNAYEDTSKPMGTEVLYVTQEELAEELSAAIATVGFIDRGSKKRTDLFFLNNTEMPAVLLEICFVDSQADADLYRRSVDRICIALADELSGEESGSDRPDRPPPEEEAAFHVIGKCSSFGGPGDDEGGSTTDEPLAFIHDVRDAPHLFLPYQPPGTTGLARRLNRYVPYVACRWDYNDTPHDMLLSEVAWVKSVDSGVGMKAFPADWGPNQNTGRVADLSPGLADALGLTTDDEVEVIFPWRDD